MTFDLEGWRGAVMSARAPSGTKLVCYTLAQLLPTGSGRISPGRVAGYAAMTIETIRRHMRAAGARGLLTAERAGHTWFVTLVVPQATDAAESAPPAITVTFGTPQWEAWLAHHMAAGDRADWVRETRTLRAEFVVGAPWPPESGDVLATAGIKLVTIPWGTPEHAAWLCHYRRHGQAHRAQYLDMGTRPTMERTRWPPVAESHP